MYETIKMLEKDLVKGTYLICSFVDGFLVLVSTKPFCKNYCLLTDDNLAGYQYTYDSKGICRPYKSSKSQSKTLYILSSIELIDGGNTNPKASFSHPLELLDLVPFTIPGFLNFAHIQDYWGI